MKLLRYRQGNLIKPGILDQDGNIKDVSAIVDDWTGKTINDTVIQKIGNYNTTNFPSIDSKISFAPCIGGVGKFICVGLNYSDHAAETGMQAPTEPIIFMKATSSICGSNDDIILPNNSKKLDWEVELGIVIGQEAKYISEKDSHKYIAGYCIVNDLSEREFQLEHLGQWVKGKSCDTFGPIGPYLATKDEIANPQKLELWLEVNNKRMQESSTSKMIFNVRYLVSYISRFMSLQPGDVISTGTPSGVGMGQKPPVFLKIGDRMRLGIEGLGEQNQIIISH